MNIPLLLPLLLLVLRPGSGEEPEFSRPPLAFLPGCWEKTGPGGATDEIWTDARGAMMLGTGRTVRPGGTVWFEYLRIVRTGDSLLYVARPSGQDEAAFLLVESDSVSLRFVNPLHDFPRSILYRFLTRDSLEAVLTGTEQGRDRTFRLEFRRRPCP